MPEYIKIKSALPIRMFQHVNGLVEIDEKFYIGSYQLAIENGTYGTVELGEKTSIVREGFYWTD